MVHTLLVSTALSLLAVGIPGQEITLVAGGDVEWSRIVAVPGIRVERRDDGWIRIPYVITPERAYLDQQGGSRNEGSRGHPVTSIQYPLEFESSEDMARYPFRRIAPVLREADIAFVNLETPLSDRARQAGAFITPTAFADGLRWAGVSVVSTANNHALDAEGLGLLDTKQALWRAGVGSVGTGENLEAARRPFVVVRNGISVAFLGYAVAVNVGGSKAFALPDRSGVAPLDPFLIKEDIQRVRDDVDFVVVSFHWAIENSQDTHPAAREFAHDIIDAGADMILGHHPHVPRGIEVYEGKVIFYSLGNFVFGHNHTYWMNNYLARLRLTRERIVELEVLPIAGTGNSLAQPYLLEGEPARTLLDDIQARSAALDTQMEILDNVGVIVIAR